MLNETLPTPERIAKGDITYNGKEIRNVCVLRIDALLEGGVIDEKQRNDCATYLSYYLASRKATMRSCLDIKEGNGGGAPNDNYILDPMHYGNLFDTVNHSITMNARRWLQCVVIDGDSLTVARKNIRCRQADAKTHFIDAITELQAALQTVSHERLNSHG